MADVWLSLLSFGPKLVDLVNSISTTSDNAKRNTQLIEFQTAIINFQSLIAAVKQENATHVDRIRELEEQIKKAQNWDAEKKRYGLAKTEGQSMVWALKKSMSAGEPAHYACTRCYEDGKARTLQIGPSKRSSHNYAFICPACANEALNGYHGPSDAKYFEELETHAVG